MGRVTASQDEPHLNKLKVNCDNGGTVILTLPSTMVTAKNRRQTAELKVAWDTGAVVTTSPQTTYLSRLEEITDVYVRGVTGAIAPIKLKGEYLPMVESSLTTSLNPVKLRGEYFQNIGNFLEISLNVLLQVMPKSSKSQLCEKEDAAYNTVKESSDDSNYLESNRCLTVYKLTTCQMVLLSSTKLALHASKKLTKRNSQRPCNVALAA